MRSAIMIYHFLHICHKTLVLLNLVSEFRRGDSALKDGLGKTIVGTQLELSISPKVKNDEEQFTTRPPGPGIYSTKHYVKQHQGPTVLVIEGMREDGTIIKEANTSLLSLVSFMYSVHDVQGLIRHHDGKLQRQTQWLELMKSETENLAKETDAVEDIILVDGVDVYRSLPFKLLKCHEWIWQNFRAVHVLKTDDDTFLDLQAVADTLALTPLQGNQWWGNLFWSALYTIPITILTPQTAHNHAVPGTLWDDLKEALNWSFRQEWSVERTGKWQEEDYTSSIYPAFACGSGYVVSRDLHLWLASNTPFFHPFQGEDVSMGIWLSALAPAMIQDARWQCFKVCQDDMLSMPDLTIQELQVRWYQFQNCSSPCAAC